MTTQNYFACISKPSCSGGNPKSPPKGGINSGQSFRVFPTASGLAQHGMDHVPVVDVVPILPQKAIKPQHLLLPVPDLQVKLEYPHPDLLPDQACRHRVAVPFDADGALLAHPHQHLVVVREGPRREVPHHHQLSGHLYSPPFVGAGTDLLHPCLVGLDAFEVPGSAQEQVLLQTAFQGAIR